MPTPEDSRGRTSTSDRALAALADPITETFENNRNIKNNLSSEYKNKNDREHTPGQGDTSAALALEPPVDPKDFIRFEWSPASKKLVLVTPSSIEAGHPRPDIRVEVDKPSWMNAFKNIFESYDTNIDSRAVRVANADQPRGRIPRLLPDMSSTRNHLLLARSLCLESLLRSHADSAELIKRTESMCADYDNTIQNRKLITRQIEHISESMEPLNERLKKTLPADSPARKLNLALIQYLSDFVHSPDKRIVQDLIEGMPLTGEIPASGSLAPGRKDAKISLQELINTVKSRNEKIISSLLNRPDSAIQKCWDMTTQEIEDGKVSELEPVTSDILSNHVLNPRFVIEQSKPRLIDDLKASRVNDTTASSDTYRPDTVDNLVLQMKRIRSLDTEADLKVFAFDFKSAYKHIGVSDASEAVNRVVVINPKDRKAYFCRMKCQPFGSRVSPRNWGRVVTLIQRLARCLFNIILFCYVDDGFAVEPSKCIDSAYECILFLAKILGFSLAPDKLIPPTAELELLGGLITIKKGLVKVSCPAEKRSKIRTLIKSHLDNRKITSAEAATLRGKLGFTQQLCQGRFGKIKTYEIAKRQYSVKQSNKLRKPLRRELKWWRMMLPRLPERTIALRPPKNNVVYSDASGGGGVSIGTVIVRFDAKGPRYPAFSGPAPPWCASENIYVLEILAACMSAVHLTQLRGTGPTIFFIDNEAAGAALVRGTSEDETARALVGCFWRVCIENNVTPWIERVCSRNNPADEPSRGARRRQRNLRRSPVLDAKVFRES